METDMPIARKTDCNKKLALSDNHEKISIKLSCSAQNWDIMHDYSATMWSNTHPNGYGNKKQLQL